MAQSGDPVPADRGAAAHESHGSAGAEDRFYFFSREETRPHVHVQHVTGEARIWLDPRVELAQNYGLTEVRAAVAVRLAEEHQDEIRAAWKAHFEG